MIKQRSVTYKTAAATMTYAEIGDVVVNSDSAVDITLPTPSSGLWYRISNVGTGDITIKYSGSTITTIKTTEQALLLSNGSSAWWMSKGSGAMTKEEIEAVLTGEITTHTHPETSHDFLDLGQVPASFTDQGGKVLAVNEAENAVEFIVAPGLPAGGTTNQLAAKNSNDDYDLKWMDAPEAANGMPAGGTENQLAAKNSDDDYDIKWMDAPEAANGLPAGGTVGQVLVKDSETDYDTSWGDPDAVKIKTKPVDITDFTGKDGYILAYDEPNGKFYLKADKAGGSGLALSTNSFFAAMLLDQDLVLTNVIIS